MKQNNILLRACALICLTSAIFAIMPPPENGLAGLRDWPFISVKYLDSLPDGKLDGPYEHTEGKCKTLIFTEPSNHDQNLCECVAIEELKVGTATNYASKIVHPFCLGCVSYCINGKCGYSIEDTDHAFAQGLATITETDGT